MTMHPSLPQPEKEYLHHLAQGVFKIQRSRSTGRHVFYPRVAAPVTGEADLEWVNPSGRGVVYAVTVINQRPPAAPYNVVLVDLEEGPRMMSRVDGVAPEAVHIGMAVQARVIEEDGKPLVVFVPVAQ
ncbi:hypothetical protein ALDI51_14180 [Alicycliphilus denitrificans]|jgi:uncharacterized OB-fold protein|uniref:Zn-ribbon domain-containing OB-fold protein n=1 Tax=Alicycliphilus denitrificans TaxID=179636 RepID=UPI000965B05B|nr:OB-fold domain-containing protein [Alicycliphilus denitrificans]MBN9574241.1 OB-fold domain-containing protein [Alicycliphilus denitrificans]OJW85782.1 MAG: hypothetical protein BGO66_11190 [Alicycliphilus sp. 69-12]BCN38099.1 hypothetical protein ALDI51_14180 [Alicycliphilus denitrificans]